MKSLQPQVEVTYGKTLQKPTVFHGFLLAVDQKNTSSYCSDGLINQFG